MDGENKENGSKISVPSEEIGRMIKLVFPGSLRQKRRFDNGFEQKTRKYGYTDLDKISSGLCPQAISGERQESENSVINYLKQFNPLGWSAPVLSTSCTSVEWVLVKPNVSDNHRIVISIEVTAEAGFKIRVGRNQLPQYIADALQPSKEELFSKEVLQNLFTFIRNCNVCSGFAVATNKVSRSQTGKTIGKPFMFKESTTAKPVQKHMSIDCETLIVQFTGNTKMCKNCSKIKHNSGKALNQTFTEETPFSKFK